MAGEDAERGGAGERGGEKRAEEMVLPPYFYNVPEMEERKWRAWFVPLIVVCNVVVMMVEMFVNECPVHGGGRRSCVAGFLGRFSFQPIRENPLLGPSSLTLEKVGALQWEKIVHGHQWWRLLVSMWLHAGLVHLLVDMLSMIFIGIRLEQHFGFVRIGTIYLISGVYGNVISSLLITKGISVGPSGALFGLLGAMFSELITNWTIYSNRAAAISTLLLIIIINLVIGILPLVNNFAHIGGFIAGFLLGFVLLMRPQFGWIERHSLLQCQSTSKYKLYQLVLWVTAIISLLVGFVVSFVILFKGVEGGEGCSWCSYMNCVPTSKWSCEN